MTIIRNVLPFVVLLIAACERQEPAESRVDVESNKAVARHWFDDGFNKGDLKVVDDAFTEGTHRGAFDSILPTGKHLRWTGADLLMFERGRISKAFFQSELSIRLSATK